MVGIKALSRREEKQRYQKLYNRLSWASHLQVANSIFVIEFSVCSGDSSLETNLIWVPIVFRP